jgi:hypothetical protein
MGGGEGVVLGLLTIPGDISLIGDVGEGEHPASGK